MMKFPFTMTKGKKCTIFLLFIWLQQTGSAQIFDKFGISIGATCTGQSWNYKLIEIRSPEKGYKTGVAAFFTAEKKMNRWFSLRPEAGYVQKGFKNKEELLFADLTKADIRNKNITFHNAAANVGLKITPLNRKAAPFLLVGAGMEYMLAFKDIVTEEPGSGIEMRMYTSAIEEFNKTNVTGVLGVGIDWKDKVYFEVDYNPPITSSYKAKELIVRDKAWIMKIGINLIHR
jgi:hypothetical protein